MRIDLVDVGLAVFDQEVDAGRAAPINRLEGVDGQLPDVLRSGRRAAARGFCARRLSCPRPRRRAVFFLVGQKFLERDRLFQHRGARFGVAQDGAVDLRRADHGPFGDDAPVKIERHVNRGDGPLPVGGPPNADGRTERGGLDEQRITAVLPAVSITASRSHASRDGGRAMYSTTGTPCSRRTALARILSLATPTPTRHSRRKACPPSRTGLAACHLHHAYHARQEHRRPVVAARCGPNTLRPAA